MATARAHPTPPCLPRHYYTRGSSHVTFAYEGVGLGPRHGYGKGPPDHGTCGMAIARAGEVHCATHMATARAHPTMVPVAWRPQGPTRPRPTSLATTIHEGRRLSLFPI